MNKKVLVCVTLFLAVVSSCANQQQKTLTPDSGLYSPVPGTTETQSFASSSTVASTPTATLELSVPANALIAFSAGLKGIYVFSPTQGTSNPILLNQEGNVLYNSTSWSPGGEMIAFEKDSKTYIINRDGSGIHLLRDEKGVVQVNPAWSPDGEHIAYITDLGLYIVNEDGRELQHLEESIALRLPAWSPDGKKLALLGDSARAYGPYKIYLVDSDGMNLRPVTGAVAGLSKLSWSPDGSKIAFRSFEGCGNINILNLATGKITNLTNSSDIVEQDPAWSPDGNYIIFSRGFYKPCQQAEINGNGGEALFIMRSDGQDITPIENAKGDQPSWWPTVLLRVGWKYSVTQAGANLNVRESPAKTAKVLAMLPKGSVFAVLDGPVQADGYDWWHIRSDAGIEGWGVDVPGWYMFESTSDAQP